MGYYYYRITDKHYYDVWRFDGEKVEWVATVANKSLALLLTSFLNKKEDQYMDAYVYVKSTLEKWAKDSDFFTNTRLFIFALVIAIEFLETYKNKGEK